MSPVDDDPSAPNLPPRPPDESAGAGRALIPMATPGKREAEDWALVLTAEGRTPMLQRTELGWQVEVETDHLAAAHAALVAWRAERQEHAREPIGPRTPETEPRQLALAYASALTLLAFHLHLIHQGRLEDFTRAGASRAALVLAGEFHRIVTALCLHADWPHVAGNTLFGGFFLAAVAGRLGVGVGVLAFFVTGALGNLANAVYYAQGHSSVGASTGVFGLVGVLTGLAAWRRHHGQPARRGAWVAFAAGLGVVAMLGGPGPQVDFSAHLFGLAAGAAAGVAIAWPLANRPRPSPSLQALSLVWSAALVAGAWRMA